MVFGQLLLSLLGILPGSLETIGRWDCGSLEIETTKVQYPESCLRLPKRWHQ